MQLPCLQLPVPGEYDDEFSEAGTDQSAYMLSLDRVLPVSKKAKSEMARVIQGLISFVERAHGLRIQVVLKVWLFMCGFVVSLSLSWEQLLCWEHDF